MPTLLTKNYKDFSIVDDGRILKTFSGAKNASKCLPGDSVDLTDTGCKLVSRCVQPMIAGLLELNSKTKFGYSGRNVPIYMFIPFNEAYPPFVVGCSEKDCSVNRLGLVRFEGQWDDGFPRGLLQRLLPVGADEEALFWTYSPLACMPYKGSLVSGSVDLSGRVELPASDTFNIDPVGCKDVDDVLTFIGSNNVVITIADVAASVTVGSDLDRRAAAICQTLYQDGSEPKHMFPAAFSEDLLSLRNGKKPGLSLRVCLDTLDCVWFESVVEVGKTFSYESVYEDSDLCYKLRRMGAAFGVDTDDSHKWIESAMKFYNVQAARKLFAGGVGVLRSHAAPDTAKLEMYNKIDPSLGFLAFKSATYVGAPFSQSTVHWGLSEATYTHATSPIRRYADLINQRCLKALIGPGPGLGLGFDVKQLNLMAKAAKQHDRDFIFLRELKKIGSTCGSVQGRLIGRKDVDNGMEKLSFYVPEWGIVVKTVLKKGDNDTVLTKDETTVIAINMGQEYTLVYRADLRARCWKKRLILRLKENTHIN